MPQGCVLGPLLFVLYTADLAPLIADHCLHSNLYADDIQVYGWSPPSDANTFQANVSQCILDVASWTSSNRLQLNAQDSLFGALLHAVAITFLMETYKSVTAQFIRSSQPETSVCTSAVA